MVSVTSWRSRPSLPATRSAYDYLINCHGGVVWQCRCGTGRCRGAIPASFFDLPADEQRRLRGLPDGWFVAEHAESSARARSGGGDMTKSRRLPPAVVSAIRRWEMPRDPRGHRASLHRHSGRSSSTGASSCDRGASSRGAGIGPSTIPRASSRSGRRRSLIRAVQHTQRVSLKDRISEAYLLNTTRWDPSATRATRRKRSRDATVELDTRAMIVPFSRCH